MGTIRRVLRPLKRLPMARWYQDRVTITLSAGQGRGLRFAPGSGAAHYSQGENEMAVQDQLAADLAAGDCFYDVGANVGFLTVIAAGLVGSGGSVVAFEPVARNAATVRRNAALNGFGHIAVVEKAVSDHSGRESLVLARSLGGAALASADTPPDPAGTEEVEVVSIDDIVGSGSVRPPSVVKIDVEGAEIEVLRGMESTLAIHRPVVIYEIDGPDETTVQAKASVCAAHLEARRYEVGALPDSYPGTSWVVHHYRAAPMSDG